MERFKKNVIRFESCRYRTKNRIKTVGQRKKGHVDVVAPQVVNNHNKSMGEVDSMNMLMLLHPIPFKSKPWCSTII